MAPADVITCSAKDGQVSVADGWLSNYVVPVFAETQDVTLLSGEKVDGTLTCVYRRPWDGSDADRDYSIIDEEQFIVWAYGSGNIENGVNYHSSAQRGVETLNLMEGYEPPIGCDGVALSGVGHDDCGVCGGDNGTCVGCDDIPHSGLAHDACGVCDGDNMTCAGCDDVPNSGTMHDVCGVCGGDNLTCAGCDGIALSGRAHDACGVCDGDGTTCAVMVSRIVVHFTMDAVCAMATMELVRDVMGYPTAVSPTTIAVCAVAMTPRVKVAMVFLTVAKCMMPAACAVALMRRVQAAMVSQTVVPPMMLVVCVLAITQLARVVTESPTAGWYMMRVQSAVVQMNVCPTVPMKCTSSAGRLSTAVLVTVRILSVQLHHMRGACKMHAMTVMWLQKTWRLIADWTISMTSVPRKMHALQIV
jgi:hypothetical protein